MRTTGLPLAVLAVLGTSTFAAEVSDVVGSCNGPNARSQPPVGAIVVDATGAYNGSFLNVSAGVAQLDPNTKNEQTIFVLPGVYHEQVLISALDGPLILQGYTCDATSYAANEVTITQATAQKDIPPEITSGRNDLTSTLRIKAKKVKAYNLNIANTAGNVGQAVAAFLAGSDYGFYACNLTGYQDTLYANKGFQLFAKTYISGAVDFVFGQYAQAWFESCDMEVVGKGSIAANGRTNATNPSFYVFNKARVFSSQPSGTAYLGRPWKPFSRVVWQNSDLSDVINPLGWDTWNGSPDTGNVTFMEFNNSGPGSPTDKRVAFSGQLNASVAITDILGADYQSAWYVDTKYL